MTILAVAVATLVYAGGFGAVLYYYGGTEPGPVDVFISLTWPISQPIMLAMAFGIVFVRRLGFRP